MPTYAPVTWWNEHCLWQCNPLLMGPSTGTGYPTKCWIQRTFQGSGSGGYFSGGTQAAPVADENLRSKRMAVRVRVNACTPYGYAGTDLAIESKPSLSVGFSTPQRMPSAGLPTFKFGSSMVNPGTNLFLLDARNPLLSGGGEFFLPAYSLS